MGILFLKKECNRRFFYSQILILCNIAKIENIKHLFLGWIKTGTCSGLMMTEGDIFYNCGILIDIIIKMNFEKSKDHSDEDLLLL